MSTNVGSLFLDLQINTNTLPNQISSIAKKTQKVTDSAFSGIGRKIAATFSVAALTAFAKSCLDLGSDLQEVQNVVDVTFPNMKDKVNDFAKSAINSFGLSETVAKRMTGTFGAMATSIGFSEKAAYDMATELTGLAGDVASFYNLDPTEAYTKLKSVFSGETETLKDLGIVMTQSALNQYALANGFGKTTDAMTEQEKVSLRMAFVTDQLSAASGDFARTSDSWANKIRVLSLNFQSLQATLGQGLINVFSPIITWLNLIIVKLQDAAKWFVAFTSLFSKKKTGNSTNQMAKDLSSSSDGAKNLAKNISSVGDSAKKAAKQMGSLASFDEINNLSTSNTSSSSVGVSPKAFLGDDLSSIDTSGVTESLSETEQMAEKLKNKWSEFVDKYGKGAKAILAITAGITASFVVLGSVVGFAKLTVGISKMATAIKAVVGPFMLAAKNFGFFKTALTGIGSLLGGVTWPIVATAAGIGAITAALVYLYSTSEEFRAFANSMFNTIIIPIADFLANIVVGTIKGLITITSSFWNKVLVPLGSFLVDVFWIALQGVIDIWNHWQPTIQNLMQTLDNIWKNILVPLGNFVVGGFCGAFQSWGDLINRLIPDVKNMFQGFTDFIVGVFTGDTQKAVDGILKIFDGLYGGIDTIFGTDLRSVFNGIVKFITGVFQSDWKKAWQGVKDIFKGIVTSLATIFKEPLNFIIRGINTFISGLNKIKIPDWVPGVGGKGFGIGKIPLLANGGYFQANSPQLAIIGDNKTQGEIVSPENKMYEVMMNALKAHGGTGNGDTAVIIEAIYQVLEAIKQLRLVVDGDSLNDDKNKRDEERALRTGRLIYDC